MSRAIGAGILGLGLAYVGYKVYSLKRSVKSKIEPIEEGHKRSWESDNDRMDIYILYSEDDFEKVETFRQYIYSNIKTQHVNVVLMDEIAKGKTIFRAFEEGWGQSLYTFLFVTETFCKDDLKVFLGDAGLIADLRRSKNLWRFVPVWVDSGIEKSGNCPLEFSVLEGIHYDRFLLDKKYTRCFDSIDRLLQVKQ